MFTIKRAAELTGVPVATLRAWERRYGIGPHQRTDAGYRLYDSATVSAIRAMQQLVLAGWAPREAAAKISGRAPRPLAPSGERATELVLQGAAELSEEALADGLDLGFSLGDFEAVVDEWLMPTLQRLGDEWVAGRLDIAGEHFASAAVMRRLGAVFEQTPQPAGSPKVLIGLPANSLHEIPGLAFATAARRRGLEVFYLGSNLPTAAWLVAVERHQPDAVAISVTNEVAEAQATITALAAANPGLRICAGGSGSRDLTAVHILPHQIGAAASDLAEILNLQPIQE